MKKIFLLCAIMFLLTGCSSVNNSSIDEIISNASDSRVKTLNTNRKGYRYYKPRGLTLKSSDNYNEVLTDGRYVYYLYVDIVSYFNKVNFSYKENPNAYYSKSLNFDGKLGYVEINNYKNNQYLIEIMYNYAKIEVIGYEQDIKNMMAYLMSIITSITYNDDIINNYLSSNEEKMDEEKFDIFEIVGSDNYLEFTTEEETNDGRHDPDYIK